MGKYRISFVSVLLCFVLSLACCFSTAHASKRNAEKKAVTTEAVQQAVPDDGYLRDRELLDRLQRDAFHFMWDHTFAESGLAYEDSRNAESGQATTGGTGFGICAIITAVDRGWITRAEAVERISRISFFLRDKTDRRKFHGAFPHWLDGRTGKTFSFSENDNGADLVETSFLMQGLLIARSFFNADTQEERNLRACITEIWEDIDWHWFTRSEKNGLYWHWSPDHDFGMGMKISGFNEALLAYVLALGSPTHPISRESSRYWYSTDEYQPKSQDGYTIEAANDFAGCMFLSHYSFIGLDPRKMSDSFVKKGYMVRNTTHALMNRAYCLYSAPKENRYGEGYWGLTSCDIKGGYRYQSAYNEVGTVAPTAALASMPYTPEYSMRFLWNIYENHRERLWGRFGPYDAFSLKEDWYDDSYLAIDQLVIVPMVENYRSGRFWKLFMDIPEVKEGLDRMGIEPLKPVNGFPHVVVPVAGADKNHLPDAVDLRRHPDTGKYNVPFSVKKDENVLFRLSTPEGKEILRKELHASAGDNLLEIDGFPKRPTSILSLVMEVGGESVASLPVRFN